MKRLNIKKAFTLAEILVVLTIIGVISAMTIPSLNQNVKKQELATSLQKAHSTLTQGVSKVKAEIGPVGLGMAWLNAEKFWPEFTKNLNTIKICGSGQSGCFTPGMIKGLNGQNYQILENLGFSAILADGMAIQYVNVGCGQTENISLDDIGSSFGKFVVDVNGHRPPNKFGEDVFQFCLVKGKGIVPAGASGFAAGDCFTDKAGLSCAAKVLQEGKINHKSSNAGGSGSGEAEQKP
ncbi:putative uncharacterized protein [Clostridium sp. CAG:306]|nr:putative uncharacterized protein [Clostridium sp. CAG:306]